MCNLTTLLCDIGGVFLTNGWDRHSRRALAAEFGLDGAAFEHAHQGAVSDFERGRMSEEEYWRRTVLAISPPGTATLAQLRAFMRSQSEPLEESFEVLRELAAERRLRLVMLNNESGELNQYRIDRFGLRRYFDTFLSSCFLDARKPHPVMYDRALRILQTPPECCVFVDDRMENLEYPRQAGWHTLLFEGARPLRSSLLNLAAVPA